MAQASGQVAVKYVKRPVKNAKSTVNRATSEHYQRMSYQYALADARHQAGALEAARTLFEELDKALLKVEPRFPKNFSLQYYPHWDLLLTAGHVEAVRDRARRTLEWVINDPDAPLLTVAVVHLALGRAAQALDQQDEAGAQLTQAVDDLRKAGRVDHIPRGLLARAAYRT